MKTLIPLALLLAPTTLAQEIVDEESEITTASEKDETILLVRYRDAVETEDAMQVAPVLAAMSAHDNAAFLPLALDALSYRASRLDRRLATEQAEELGQRSRKVIEEMVALREGEVQGAAAALLANYPENRKVTRALVRTYEDKDVQKDKPTVAAAAISALGTLGYDELEDDMVQEIEQAKNKEVARAAVRYLGQIETKDYGAVRKLCEMLSSPQPANVNSAQNPPAGYWAAKWEVWSWTRRDVTWSLKQITGQTFRPEEGEHEGDSKKALDYIREHKRELGLR